jgi:hypothetical protein
MCRSMGIQGDNKLVHRHLGDDLINEWKMQMNSETISNRMKQIIVTLCWGEFLRKSDMRPCYSMKTRIVIYEKKF